MERKCTTCGHAVIMSSEWGVFEPFAAGCMKTAKFVNVDENVGCDEWIAMRELQDEDTENRV